MYIPKQVSVLPVSTVLNIPLRWREPTVRTNGATHLVNELHLDQVHIILSWIYLLMDRCMHPILILYESYTIRSMIESAKGLSSPPRRSYRSSSLNCEQKMIEDFFRLL